MGVKYHLHKHGIAEADVSEFLIVKFLSHDVNVLSVELSREQLYTVIITIRLNLLKYQRARSET